MKNDRDRSFGATDSSGRSRSLISEIALPQDVQKTPLLADEGAEKDQQKDLVNTDGEIGFTAEGVYDTTTDDDGYATKNHDPQFSCNVHFG